MLPKSLVKISFVGVGNVFNAVLGFAFLAIVAKSLDLAQFGKYALLSTLLVALSKLMDFGSNSVFVTKHTAEEQSQFILLKIFLFALTVPLSLLALRALNLFSLALVPAVVIGLVGYGINYTLFAFFQKSEMFLNLILLNTIPALIKATVGVLFLLNVVRPTLQVSFYAFALSVFPSAILYFTLPKALRKPRLRFDRVSGLLKESAPAGISLLIKEGWPAISNSIAKVVNGFSQVGVFALSDKISQVFSLASLSIFTVLLPKNAARKNAAKDYDRDEAAFFALGMLVLAFVGILVAKIFVRTVFSDKFNGSLAILDILIYASAFSAIHSFLENYFFIEKQTTKLMIFSIAKLVVFLALALSLTPVFSLTGLAVSQLISNGLVAAVIFLTVWRGEKSEKSVITDGSQ